jgi:hypothetical protein
MIAEDFRIFNAGSAFPVIYGRALMEIGDPITCRTIDEIFVTASRRHKPMRAGFQVNWDLFITRKYKDVPRRAVAVREGWNT